MADKARIANRNLNVARIARIYLADRSARQADLARVLDMDSGTMSKAMNGTRNWTVVDLEKMAEFFDISVSIFFEDADALLRSRWHSQQLELCLT